eukprot:Polyplicarium_translucidae@DN461_c0_g1_i1.p1
MTTPCREYMDCNECKANDPCRWCIDMLCFNPEIGDQCEAEVDECWEPGSAWQSTWKWVVLGVGIFFALVLIASIACCCWCCCRRRSPTKTSSSDIEKQTPSAVETAKEEEEEAPPAYEAEY